MLDAKVKLRGIPENGIKKFPVTECVPLVVCLECGFARFKLSGAGRQLLEP